MFPIRQITLASYCAFAWLAFGDMAASGETIRDLEKRVETLKKENARLSRQVRSMQLSLADANRSESESSQALARIKARLKALDRSVFSTRDEDLINAVSRIDQLIARNAELEDASYNLASQIQAYIGTAVVSDPDLRLSVEESIRNLDSVLGLRQKPRPNLATGTLKDANVVSIDSESGLLVFNVGKESGARIGMTFSLRRGDQTLGEATLVDVRPQVAGAFVDSLFNSQLTVKLGDAASLKTVQQ